MTYGSGLLFQYERQCPNEFFRWRAVSAGARGILVPFHRESAMWLLASTVPNHVSLKTGDTPSLSMYEGVFFVLAMA